MKHLILLFALLYFAGKLSAQKVSNTIDSLQSSLKTAKDDSTRAGILREMGLVYVDMGDYPQGIEVFLKSKDLFQSSQNKQGIFKCDNILGVTYCFMGDYETALTYLLNSQKGFDDGWVYDNLGLVYYHKKDYKKSLFYFKEALAIYRKLANTKLIANKLNDVGSLYEIIGNSDTAISYYFESLKMSEKLNDKMNIVEAYASLGDIYFKQKKYSLSLEYENKSLKIAKEINYLISIRETEKTLSDIYFSLNNPTKSLEHYKNYISIKDSLVNETNIKRLVRVEEKFKFEKEKELTKMEQEKKDAIKQEELRHQKNQRNIFIAGFGMVLCLSVFLFMAFKRNQKAKLIITAQKKIVEEKKKEMTDNINYAQRIQKAILPSDEYINNNMPENFIIYKPKDIVSGDFYWAYSDAGWNYIATADCTGHGVSGAMMSMIGTQLLNEIVIERNINRPDLVLNALRDEIIKALNPKGAVEERKDGMDISFCRIPKIGVVMESACANNSIYIVRHAQVIEIKANRFPVGKYVGNESFTLNETYLQREDIIYTLSDGFCDQFGGEKGKKLMTKKFKEWITAIPHINMSIVKNELENRFSNWIGDGEQIDDVTIVAIKF